MKINYLGKLFFILAIISSVHSLEAHQPILNSESEDGKKNHFVIEEPEISKAIYAELKGQPHYYQVSSEIDFRFYAGITVPKIEGCTIRKKFSLKILDSDFQLINHKDGEKFEWWPWYEKHGKKWYWIGPEIGKNFKSNRVYEKGTYYIKVFNKDNSGQYALAVGDIESFPFTVIVKLLFTLPKINSIFWDDVECPGKKKES